jgi:hypothetical protein
MPINPPTPEEEVGGSQFDTSLGKNMRPYLKNCQSKKGCGYKPPPLMPAGLTSSLQVTLKKGFLFI